MIENIQYLKVSGSGNLVSLNYNLNVGFTLFLINENILIYCTTDDYPHELIDILNNNNWSLQGETEDNVPLLAKDLSITCLTNHFIELSSISIILLGKSFSEYADKIEYPIANLFDTKISFVYDSFNINIETTPHPFSKNISMQWGIPQVGATLILEKNYAHIKDYTELANYIIKLLSLVTGRQICINVETFYLKEKCFTSLQYRYLSTHDIGSIISNDNLCIYLTNALPIIKSWDTQKFNDFRIILEYINSTGINWIDERILRLIQAYEIIAKCWIKQKYKPSKQIKSLKDGLKPVLKKWKEEYSSIEPGLKDSIKPEDSSIEPEFIINRIYDAIEWDRTVKLVESVLENSNLDNKILQVDFKKLVQLRHYVAHTGRCGNIDASQDIINGQFALRVYLLKILGYKGEIQDYRGSGFAEIKDITDFYTQNIDS